MSEQAPRQPITGGEREILFQIQQLQAKWIDTIQMCLQREASHRQRILVGMWVAAIAITQVLWVAQSAIHQDGISTAGFCLLRGFGNYSPLPTCI
jgi:hypothetical protein